MSLPAAPPRLTRLELHGFKSFAGRTVFAFESGITAVIGPNGSGKSNISDAVRWALGEQSHGALRSKRTEDVIFAGGSGRAPSGMAEVAVTFDNTSGWLPIAFSEVTVTRRAYRTGENQYLINGKRVRLREVAHLTASLGQSHTVVGQGLVDAALSQRAEERRGLFEHAADLTGLRLKAAEAERNLAETETNSARLMDLLTELEPRLKTLERAARQAREWKGVQDRLHALQRGHYGRLLRVALGHLTTVSEVAAAGTAALNRGREEVDRLVAAVQVARVAAEDTRAVLAQQDARLQAVLDQVRRIGHERDLAGERYAALTRRREDMAYTQTGLDEQVAAVTAELTGLAGNLAAVEADAVTARATVARLQADGAAARDARARLERRLAALTRTLRDQERAAGDLARRRALLEQRRATDSAERARAEAANAARRERVTRLAEELAAFDRSADADEAEVISLDARLNELARAADQATTIVQAARAALGEAERNLGQVTTRLEVLQRLHESGTGLHAGVRATLQAARAGNLQGIRGTVAELIQSPSAYDTAIEVALGGHLQDVVVERWADAEAAIAHLRRTNAGRATFQPLDTVGGGSRGRATPAARRVPRDALALPGVHGVAGDLVRVAPELGVVVGSLLGRTLVMADLPTARAALPLLPTGWSVVTLSGEIARTGGSVTGGAAVRESGVLTRERELRELPAEVERLRQARETAVAVLEAASEEPRRIAAERQAVEATRAGVVAAGKERRGQRARLAGWLNDLQTEQATADRRVRALDEALAARLADLLALDGDAAALDLAVTPTRAEQDAALAEQARDAEAVAAADRILAEEQRRLATLDERLRAERRRQSGLVAQQRALADELALRGERAAALDGERAALDAQHQRLSREAAHLETERAEIAAERSPREVRLRQTVAEADRLTRALEAAREALLDLERAHGTGELSVERARGELATIRQRIVDDLELDDPDELLLAPDASDAQTQPTQPGASQDVEREIARLRERLRRVGYVGEDVVEEYERESTHQAFLRGQLTDVQEAAAALRVLLADLQSAMKERFDATFVQVADAFTETFTTLFGGGSARLVLAPGEDGAAGGIDIVAQPPGKRLQSLALLSGGERALTAAALLFAILRVNPAPFCLLDEVDAALDEANVVRFREQLRALAAQTQVVVITHNRGTIESADTLYGVSMGDDGVSQVLSLRLAEVAAG